MEFEQLEYDSSLYGYYQELNKRYEKWFEDFDICPKIQIDGDKYDFVEDEEAKLFVLEQIKDKLAEIEEENSKWIWLFSYRLVMGKIQPIYYAARNLEKQ